MKIALLLVLRIPSESYGFSNDARSSFGAPSYEEAAFTLATESMILEVRLR